MEKLFTRKEAAGILGIALLTVKPRFRLSGIFQPRAFRNQCVKGIFGIF